MSPSVENVLQRYIFFYFSFFLVQQNAARCLLGKGTKSITLIQVISISTCVPDMSFRNMTSTFHYICFSPKETLSGAVFKITLKSVILPPDIPCLLQESKGVTVSPSCPRLSIFNYLYLFLESCVYVRLSLIFENTIFRRKGFSLQVTI